MSSVYRDREDETNIVPNSLKNKYRACLRCHLIKTEEQFKEDGCNNCPFFISSSWSTEDFTTTHFEGFISIMNPEESWVSRWLDLESFMPGCYCLKVFNDLPPDVLEYFKEKKIKYVRNVFN